MVFKLRLLANLKSIVVHLLNNLGPNNQLRPLAALITLVK